MQVRVTLTKQGLRTFKNNLTLGKQDDIEIRIGTHHTDDCIGVNCRIHNYFGNGPRFNTLAVGQLDMLVTLTELMVEESINQKDGTFLALLATTKVAHPAFMRWMTLQCEAKYQMSGTLEIKGLEPSEENSDIIIVTMEYKE